MQFKQLFDDEDGVSPVIGVILMVAITVILAAVIGTFVLGLGDQVSSTAPSASFTFDYTNNSGAQDSLDVTHDGGDKITASQLNATVSDAEDGEESPQSSLDWGPGNDGSGGNLFGSSGDVSAGSTYTVDGDDFADPDDSNTNGEDAQQLDLSGATLRVVWTSSSGGDTATLGKWTGPDA